MLIWDRWRQKSQKYKEAIVKMTKLVIAVIDNRRGQGNVFRE